jgi:AraC family transcriptional regulator
VITRLNDGGYFGTRAHIANLAGLRISQAVYQPRTLLPRHAHARAYLCLVATGAFEERARRRAETCAARSAVWNPSGDEHEDLFGPVGARMLNFEFTDSWHERLREATPHWTPARSADVTWLVTRILRELSEPDRASALALEGLVCGLIGEVSRRPPPIDRTRPVWLVHAEDRLMAEYRQPPTLAELARSAGVHRSHFARSFRRHIGCTVAEFVRRLRIAWAAEQLRGDRHTLSELALEAGFGDQPHFTRSFKRIMGMTPGEYRAAMR